MSFVQDARAGRKADNSANLPLLKFEDLRGDNGGPPIVRTWQTPNKWIDEDGFPPGRMIGKYRFWTQAEVMRWIEEQPSDREELRGAAAKKVALRGEPSDADEVW